MAVSIIMSVIHVTLVAALHVPLITSFQPPLSMFNKYYYYPVDISTIVIFPIPVPCNITQYCTVQVLLHGCSCMGPGATRYPSNHDVL